MTGTSVGAPPTAAEADQLVVDSLQLPRAAELLDPARLSDLLGQPVAITHSRLKPGHSVVVAHRDENGNHGWTMLTNDSDKFRKAQQRAADFAQQLWVHQEGADSYLCSGTVWSDPMLSKELAEARTFLDAQEGRTVMWQILRYNPRRRVVAMVDAGKNQKVVRVLTSGVESLLTTFRTWRSLDLPVTHSVPLGRRGSATLAPLWGAGDLAQQPHRPAAASAGDAVGRLHAATHGTNPHRVTPANPSHAAVALSLVAPWAAERAHELARRCTDALAPSRDSRAAQIHGDLSPDQVILAAAGSHKIRIIDLERAGFGHPMHDIGSWSAACRQSNTPELIEPFLAAYAARAPLLTSDLHAWEAYSHLSRTTDFFRHRHAQWPAQTLRALDLAEEALNR